MFPNQAEVSTLLTNQTKPLVINLEGEWEYFNKMINIEEHSVESLTNPKETTMEMVIERVVDTQEVENILIDHSSKIILRVDEIPPLDVFYSSEHKFVIRKQ